jgi:hypothetical protein
VVQTSNAANPINSQLNTSNARQVLQRLDPIRELIRIVCSVIIDKCRMQLQTHTSETSTSFGQPLPDGMVRAADDRCHDDVAVGNGRAFG